MASATKFIYGLSHKIYVWLWLTSAIDLMSTCPTPPLALAAQQLAMKIEAAATDNGERPHTRLCSLALQAINLD